MTKTSPSKLALTSLVYYSAGQLINRQLLELKDSHSYMNKHADMHTQPLMFFLLIYLRKTNAPCKGDCMRFTQFSVKHLENKGMRNPT